MSTVAARAVCAASADLGSDDTRADPGADGLAKPGADGHADPGSDGLAESGADGRADPGADGRAARYWTGFLRGQNFHRNINNCRKIEPSVGRLSCCTHHLTQNQTFFGRLKLLGQRTMLLIFWVKKLRLLLFEGTILRRFRL